jgi:hypothetical protein
MEYLFYIFIFIFVFISCIIFINTNTNVDSENFTNSQRDSLLTLNANQRCNILGVKKFMIRDLNTKLWLIYGQQEGFNKFLPGRFGIPLLMSPNPSDYLPLRIVASPDDYLLANYEGDGIQTMSNPQNENFIIQVFIYHQFNVLGYIDETNETKYLCIDPNGNISSSTNPSNASIMEIIEI